MTNLERTIADHRAMMREELDFNPTQRTPPVAYTWSDTERALVPDDRPLVINPLSPDEQEIPDSATQSTQVGMPMSGRMLRYLQGPTADTPWASALKSLRAECRRKHPYHRAADAPFWRGSLCWQLTYLVIVGKPRGGGPATIEEAAGILRYDNPEPILRYALTYIEEVMDSYRRKAEKRAREEDGHGPGAVPNYVNQQRHDQPGLHRQDCPKCRREDVA